MNTDNIISNKFNDSQQKAIQSPLNGPLLIVAGAGSGKTTTLTARLKFLIENGISPNNIVAITFTNKAANEMKERINKDSNNLKGLFVGTFHGFGVSILKREAHHLNRNSSFSIFDSNDSKKVIKDLIKKNGINTKQFSPAVLIYKIGKIKNNYENINHYKESKQKIENVVADLYEKYEQELEKLNAFDFDDLIHKVVFLWTSKRDVLQKYQNRFPHILVDEYQDVNNSQYKMVKLLSGESQNINVVGDDNQAIYGFRGADFTNFLNFDKDFKNAKVILLEQNYRSTKNIIGAAGSLIACNKVQRPKELWTQNEEGKKVQLQECFSEYEESSWLVNNLAGKDLKNTAILYRTNAQSRPLEQELIENNIPYTIFGGLRFYDRLEIKDLVAAMRYAVNPQDLISLDRLDRNLYKAQFNILKDNLPTWSKKFSPGALLEKILKDVDYISTLSRKYPNSYERVENIKELINFAGSFRDTAEFVESISLFESSSPKEKNKADCLKLMTIHLSKGLEFDNVYVVGVNESLLPHERSIASPEEIEEERRLLYVAMTRAKKDLSLSFYDIPSRFISDISPSFLEVSISRDLDDEERYIEI